MLELYTDGSCLTNPGGAGGWGAVLARNGEILEELSGGEQETTNNRMEITAVINGLERIPEGDAVTVYSDSEYVVNTMTRGWNRRRNQDLWDQLDRLVTARTVSWQWVRGHATTELNNRADRLAVDSARQMLGDIDGNPNGEDAPKKEPPPGLSHVDASGAARMVNVGEKAVTQRQATATGTVVMQPQTLKLIREGGFEKGDVFTLARVAGIMAAKRTHELIPLCHQIPLNQVEVELRAEGEDRVTIQATAEAEWKTGVEMEALTAVTVAALTVYDMCKSVDRGMRIEGVRLLRKAGGRSGEWVSEG